MTQGHMHRRAVLAGAAAVAMMRPAPGAATTDAIFGDVAKRAAALDQLHALVVMERGKIRFSRAFRGPALDRTVNVKSVSKTILALTTGIAVARGVLPGPEARLVDVAPAIVPRNATPSVQEIRLSHLLTMTAGLQRTSGPYYGDWVASRNWTSYVLTRPQVAAPGARFQYSTGVFHVLGAAIASAAGRDLHALTQEWLARPLGIEIPPWTRAPEGFFMGGNNMALSPLGLARLGETVRNAGRLDGAAVIPADWIETSWRARTRSPFSGDDYGFGWFLTRLGGVDVAYGRGYGGQMLYVVPAAEAVIAVTSDPTRPARTRGHVGDLNRLVATGILPALGAAGG
ncbi:MAG: serine hydrolase [Pseudomonadota bacterium]